MFFSTSYVRTFVSAIFIALRLQSIYFELVHGHRQGFRSMWTHIKADIALLHVLRNVTTQIWEDRADKSRRNSYLGYYGQMQQLSDLVPEVT